MGTIDPTIGIVTVLYNSGTVLDEFFATLESQTYRNFILYVIDNHSPDDSLAKARVLSAGVSFRSVVIAEPENWGVAKGNNIGIRRALDDGCDMVLLSNNDIVLEPGTIGTLLSGMLDTQATIAIPKIYFHGTDLIWAAGGCFDYFRGHTRHYGVRRPDRGEYDRPRTVEYTPTCFALIRREVFLRVGMMDEAYFVYYDDTDFMYRATKIGSETIAYVPSSRLWHKESTSTGGQMSDFAVRYMERNSTYFLYKNLRFPQRQIVLLYRFLHTLLRKPFSLTRPQRQLSRRARREGKELARRLRTNR